MKVLPFPGPGRSVGVAADGSVSGSAAEPVVDDALEPGGASGASPALDGEDPKHYDRITIRAITVAIVLSLLVHVVVLLLPLINKADEQKRAPADEIGPLSVTIADSRPQPAPTPTPQPRADASVVQPQPQPPRPAPRPTPRPVTPRPQPRLAIEGRTSPFNVQPAPQPPAPETPPTPQPVKPTDQDFSEVLAARQQARRNENGGAPDEVLESDDQRANRIAKANIAAQRRSSSPGEDQSEAGGIFELKHTGAHDAEFVFNGWNRDFRRKLGKTYEVQQGNNPSIQLAVVRQMIEIIREQQPGDFEWYSPRLKGRSVIMSARPKDQKELEAFLMKEFYEGGFGAH